MKPPIDVAVAIFGTWEHPEIDLNRLWEAIDIIHRQNQDYEHRRRDCEAFHLRFDANGKKTRKTYKDIALITDSGNAQVARRRINRTLTSLRHSHYLKIYQPDLGVIECPNCHHRFKSS